MAPWKCLTCGYETKAADAPERCPVCGAPRTQFVTRSRFALRLARDMVDAFLVHPVAAHVPNGAFPVAVLFLLLADLTGRASLEQAAFLLLVLTVFVIPVSMVSGVRDWKLRYGGRKAPIFRWKIVLSTVLLNTGAFAVLLRLLLPGVAERNHPLHWVYVTLVLLMMVLVVLLGHFGGKLVFGWKKVTEGQPP